MTISTVFINNRTQAVRLPIDLRLPDCVLKVDVRAKGNQRIISPVGQSWDSFFLNGPAVSDDFMPERASQHQSARESLGCCATCSTPTSSSMSWSGAL